MFQPSARPTDQKEWLAAKFELYRKHHDSKTLGQFFPPLYEEYFSYWPPTPTELDIGAAAGNTANATAKVRKEEEHVSDFKLTK